MQYQQEQLVQIITDAAKEELLPRFNKVARQLKADGSFITEADTAMQTRVEEQLWKLDPNIMFLGEEMEKQEQNFLLSQHKPIWCLDPLDGTSNYSAGIPYFSVSLALLDKGKVKFGIVYDPVRDECFVASHGEGAMLNGHPLALHGTQVRLKHATALVDFKRLDDALATRLVTCTPYASQRSFGSVALDWCWLAAGRCHVYLHGRQNIWDYAAGNLIFQESGGHSSTLQSEPVFVNELIGRSAVAARDATLFKEWCEWLQLPH